MSQSSMLMLAVTGGVLGGWVPAGLRAQAPVETVPETELSPFAVETTLGLSDDPALGLATPVTSLRFTPGVDLQSRGYPELQSDFTVRGSTFEQTGVALGTVPLFDPQTGHYTTELPFSGEMLQPARLLLGAENARRGFNANVATLGFDWAPIAKRGRAVAGFGTEALVFGELYQGSALGDSGWAWDVSAGHGQGDGTVAGGDFRVWRGAVRVQHRDSRGQTDLAAGWLDKSYGWPGMYTGFASLLETDDYQNLVVVANHRHVLADGGFWALGAAYREMDDDYYFNRRTPPAERTSRFQHLTRVLTVAGEGRWVLSDVAAVFGRAVLLGDELVRSTSLTNGDSVPGNDFTDRRYAKVVAAGEWRWREGPQVHHQFEAGIAGSMSNRDTGRLSPHFRWERTSIAGDLERMLFAQLTETSQVPGYTALRSPPSGLFGGNAKLGRELSRIAEVGAQWADAQWHLRGAVFLRRDKDLVDWTYADGAPNARQANPLDLETWGLELQAVRHSEKGTFRLGYAWLEKDADYRGTSVDGSFYVLNFPVHRFTTGFTWQIFTGFEFAAEGAYRIAEKNARRTSGEEALLLSLALRWQPWGGDGVELNLLVDNLADDDFQEFPGTPAVGRHGSIRAIYRW